MNDGRDMWSQSPQRFLIFSVQDTGIGIVEEERARLFERFKQGNVRTHVTYGGNGLGLYICKQIINLLAGDIWAESERNKGSLFSFYVPAATTPPPASPVSAIALYKAVGPSGSFRKSLSEAVRAPPDEQGSSKPSPAVIAATIPRTDDSRKEDSKSVRILVTEDNQINQALLRKQLTGAGYIVAVANDGIEALEYVQASNAAVEGGHVLHCILMDIEMPRMGGIECTMRIRQLEGAGYLKGHLPIIAVSANSRAEQVQKMLDSGMDGAIAKPFKKSELLTKIRTLTE